jgi:hypothetical protein
MLPIIVMIYEVCPSFLRARISQRYLNRGMSGLGMIGGKQTGLILFIVRIRLSRGVMG